VERIDKETLKAWLDDPDVFILDVRTHRAWEGSQTMVRHAHRFDPQQPVETWALRLPKDKKLVAY